MVSDGSLQAFPSSNSNCLHICGWHFGLRLSVQCFSLAGHRVLENPDSWQGRFRVRIGLSLWRYRNFSEIRARLIAANVPLVTIPLHGSLTLRTYNEMSR